jgi:hypothetical protein
VVIPEGFVTRVDDYKNYVLNRQVPAGARSEQMRTLHVQR